VKRALRYALLVLAPFVLVEIGLRIQQRISLRIPFWQFGVRAESASADDPATAVTLDSRLGWRPSSGWQMQGQARDADGKSRPISVSQKHPHGLRAFGDVKKPRLLAVGDSFTQAVCVGDGDTYYERVGAALGLEVFGGGSTGWGTLQELQYLDEIIDEIRPDVILLQFNYNDFMDNDFELGRRWKAGCQTSVRPYLEHGNIEYRYSCHGAWASWTRLGYFIVTRLDRLRAHRPERDELLQEILTTGSSHPGFAAAVAHTSEIFDRVRARAGATPVVFFDVGITAEPFFSTVRRLATEHGFILVGSLPAALDDARKRGVVIECEDRIHFNPSGHRVIADAIVEAMRAQRLPH
jgi:lysophospholipase L1-like esterase